MTTFCVSEYPSRPIAVSPVLTAAQRAVPKRLITRELIRLETAEQAQLNIVTAPASDTGSPYSR